MVDSQPSCIIENVHAFAILIALFASHFLTTMALVNCHYKVLFSFFFREIILFLFLLPPAKLCVATGSRGEPMIPRLEEPRQTWPEVTCGHSN